MKFQTICHIKVSRSFLYPTRVVRPATAGWTALRTAKVTSCPEMHGVLGTRKQQNMPHPQIVMPMTWRDFCFEKETVDISLYTILSLFFFFFLIQRPVHLSVTLLQCQSWDLCCIFFVVLIKSYDLFFLSSLSAINFHFTTLNSYKHKRKRQESMQNIRFYI